ncbi:MAG: hypothetical protein ACRELB_12975, partial [Polyangiaceae bacterium]
MRGTLSRGIVAIACLAAFAGCNQHSTSSTGSSQTQPDTRVRLVAHFIDAETGAPVGAVLTACGFGAAAADGTGVATLDVIGVTNSNGGTNVSFRVDASGYASLSFQQNVSSSDNNGNGPPDENTNDITVNDMGIIRLNRARTLTVVVTEQSKPVAGATVIAALDQNAVGIGTALATIPASGSGACQVVLTGTTDGNGAATISGIDFSSGYSVVVPAQNLTGTGFG